MLVRSSKMRVFSFDHYIFRMKFPTGFTYRNLHGFAWFPGDSISVVYTVKQGSDRSHVGRSILAVLLATILAISHVSINPAPSVCQLLFIIFAPRRCCLATAAAARERGRGHCINMDHAKRSDCSNLTVTELRC